MKTKTPQQPNSANPTAAKHASPDPNSPEEIKRAKSLQQAFVARHLSIPANLSAMMGATTLDGLAAKFYMDQVKFDAGKPTDPIERMLLEQLVMAHHHIAMMHVTAATSKTVEAIKVNYSMLARLTGEFRRTALAIRNYRLPPAQKSFSVVKQQNVVANGEQTVTYVAAKKKKKETLSATAKVKRKAPDGIDQRINGNGNLNQKSKTGRSGQEERGVAAALD